jgi:glycosyltransferase involved in cell wall biosynthesis
MSIRVTGGTSHDRGVVRDAPRPARLAHFTTIDASLAKLLATELTIALEAGYDVYGISAPGKYVSEIEALGVSHVALPALTRSWSLVSDLKAIRELWGVLGRLDLDVLHTHTPKAGVIGRIVGWLRRVPIIVNTCHGLPATQDDRASKRLAVYAVEALAAQFSDAELFQNHEDHRLMSRFLCGRAAEVVGNGIDLERFKFDPVGRNRVRRELGVDEQQLVVGAVGRRVAEKGMLEYSEVASQLGDRATFWWVGPQDFGKSDALSEDLSGVTFLGERTDMAAVYSAMDVFVLASHREGFPRSAMEAAACARPLILTDIRGSREVGRAGTEALFVPVRDPVSLANALIDLFDEPDRRVDLGRAACSRARQAFDQRQVAERSFQTYRLIADRKKSRAVRSTLGRSQRVG